MRTLIFCNGCEQETEHLFIFDAPHGIAGAVMAGSECHQCSGCGSIISSSEAKERGVQKVENYCFLQSEGIAEEDIRRVIFLTKGERLTWQSSDDSYAFQSFPSPASLQSNEEACKDAIGENLRDVRVGYNPESDEERPWHYLRLSDYHMNHLYVEEGSPQEVMALVDELWDCIVVQVGKEAVLRK